MQSFRRHRRGWMLPEGLSLWPPGLVLLSWRMSAILWGFSWATCGWLALTSS